MLLNFEKNHPAIGVPALIETPMWEWVTIKDLGTTDFRIFLVSTVYKQSKYWGTQVGPPYQEMGEFIEKMGIFLEI